MLMNYIKIAAKVLLRRKFYTAINLTGIAFTILTLLIAAAIADNVIAPGAPESDLDRMLVIDRAVMSGKKSVRSGSPGYRLMDQYGRDLPGAENYSITSNNFTVTSFVGGGKIESEMRRTDGAFWEIMDFSFIEGGPFTAADEQNGSFVAVITETTRRRFFGEGASAAGKTIRADGQVFTVVGVVRDVPVTRTYSFAEVWTPISTAKSTSYRNSLMSGFQGIILAESRDAIPGIQAEFARRLEAAQLPEPDRFDKLKSRAFSRMDILANEAAGDPDNVDDAPIGTLVLIITAVVGAFMLLPALNLMNLSLSRILERSSEIGVRKAFGASSGTLVGQFLVENVVLTLVGGALGLGLAAVALRILTESGLIPYARLGLSPRTFIAGLMLSLVFACLAGAFPAWRMSRIHPVEALHGRVK